LRAEDAIVGRKKAGSPTSRKADSEARREEADSPFHTSDGEDTELMEDRTGDPRSSQGDDGSSGKLDSLNSPTDDASAGRPTATAPLASSDSDGDTMEALRWKEPEDLRTIDVRHDEPGKLALRLDVDSSDGRKVHSAWDASGLKSATATDRDGASTPVPLSMEVEVRMVDGGDIKFKNIALPTEWAWKLNSDSIVFRVCKEGHGPFLVGRARLAAEWSHKVIISAWRPGDLGCARHNHMSQLMGFSGFVPKIYEYHHVPEATYILSEVVGVRNLESFISECSYRKPSDWDLNVPLQKAVPLMIDMLKGLQVMENFGMAIGDLSEHSIHLVEDDSHAVLVDLSSAGLLHGVDDDLSARKINVSYGSAYRHAPEMLDGRPNAVSNNVWQLGLVFARMMAGNEVPTVPEVRRSVENPDDTTEAGRREIRETIRTKFSIRHAPGFGHLAARHRELMRILEGMLDVSPESRWSASMALSAAMEMSVDQGLPLSVKRGPDALPKEWTQDFQ